VEVGTLVGFLAIAGVADPEAQGGGVEDRVHHAVGPDEPGKERGDMRVTLGGQVDDQDGELVRAGAQGPAMPA
jgi:hypothetical protein